MRDVICQAIRERRLLSVQYKGLDRVLEPYLLFESKSGDLILHSWQVEGDWEHSPPPDWSNLNLSDLSSVRPLDRTYAHPRPDYNPNSPRFHRVICRTWCRKPAKSKSQSSAPGARLARSQAADRGR